MTYLLDVPTKLYAYDTYEVEADSLYEAMQKLHDKPDQYPCIDTETFDGDADFTQIMPHYEELPPKETYPSAKAYEEDVRYMRNIPQEW